MIIKLKKIISCSSEHPSYPASNLLEYHSDRSWRCAKSGEMLATVIFQMAEPSCICGIDIGNYRSCVVIVDASTESEPDKWIPIINHQFLTNDEAVNNKFRDQVQIFTKKDLNPETVKIKFDRIKVTCMQSANPRTLFGLSFITFKTEVVVDLGLDVFGRFKLKQPDEAKSKLDEFKERYSKILNDKPSDYKNDLKTKVKESALESFEKRQAENREPAKRPLLKKLEEGKADEMFEKINEDSNKTDKTDKKQEAKDAYKVKYTPFGDVIPEQKMKNESVKNDDASTDANNSFSNKLSNHSNPRKHSLESVDDKTTKKLKCSACDKCSKDTLCKNCNQLLPEKPNDDQTKKKEKKKRTKDFSKLLDDVKFSLSGYVNPQRDSIRRKALQMGAKYVADPNTTDKQCTHLICAFKNTPKYQQLKNHSKIVSHTFIEDCFDKKTRFPWRRYALDNHEKNQPESEDEIEASSTNIYDMDTDDSDSNY